MTASAKEPPLQQVISDLFRDFDGDEVGGKHAMRGFNFQVWHAVLEALRAHRTGKDYAVVLEWQQDVAVLNSSSAPTGVRFVQLKKHESSTHWKLHHLIKPEKADAEVIAANDGVASGDGAAPSTTETSSAGKSGKGEKASKGKTPKKPKQSFLAKLYVHRRRFKELAQSRLEFASDAKFEIPDGAGIMSMLSSVELSALDAPVRMELETRLREQLQLPAGEAVDLSDFALVVSDCPVNDAHKYLAGELAEMQLGSELSLSGSATMLAVLVIASYVNLRAGSGRFAKNFEELLGRAVTRKDIAHYLDAANEQTIPTQDKIQFVINRLTFEGAPFPLINGMNREVSRACVDVTNRGGPVPLVAAYLKDLYARNSEYNSFPRATDMFAAWFEDFQKLAFPEAHLYKREYLYCLMSMITQDANPTKQLPLVPSGAQPEDRK